MKKHLTLHTTGKIIVFLEVLLSIVAGLCVLIINGPEGFGQEHFTVLLLAATSAASIYLLRLRKPLYHKIVLGLSLLPVIFLLNQGLVAFLLPQS